MRSAWRTNVLACFLSVFGAKNKKIVTWSSNFCSTFGVQGFVPHIWFHLEYTGTTLGRYHANWFKCNTKFKQIEKWQIWLQKWKCCCSASEICIFSWSKLKKLTKLFWEYCEIVFFQLGIFLLVEISHLRSYLLLLNFVTAKPNFFPRRSLTVDCPVANHCICPEFHDICLGVAFIFLTTTECDAATDGKNQDNGGLGSGKKSRCHFGGDSIWWVRFLIMGGSILWRHGFFFEFGFNLKCQKCFGFTK